jgi:hypothetical protein
MSEYQVRLLLSSIIRHDINQSQILFLWNDGDLILKARKLGDSQVLQFIPRSKLAGDFSRCIVDEYTHWLDLSTGELEFRPAGSPWTHGPSNWRLYPPHPDIYPHAVLRKPSHDNSSIRVIDIRSTTFGVVSGLLSSLESPAHIIATLAHTTQTLEVFLPRLRLSFFINTKWELECRSMPGYVVDNTQSFGTMFGLENKLILCPSPTSSEVSLFPRRVIIPQGEISFNANGDFTRVSINTDADKHVYWHEYTVDNDLGCLTNDTSLGSKLYKCYLHALTSHCLPDPLLGHTGTEEALYILRSAACKSFQRLDTQAAKLLELISNLTPIRIYNSRHLRSMATIRWNDLPALSQHHDFFPAVCSILDHARALEALYDPPTVFNISGRNRTLLNRAACRNRSYYPPDLSISEKSSSGDDVEYMSRDVSDHETAEDLAFRTSWSLWNAQPSLDHAIPELWYLMKSWGSLGPPDDRITISLQYSSYWLEFDAPRDWVVICNLIRKSAQQSLRDVRIELSFSLSAAAYGRSRYSKVVPFIILFALDERCRNLSYPLALSYTLSDGVAPEFTRVVDLVSESAVTKYKEAIARESSLVAGSIIHQWPRYRSVDIPEEWFDKSSCIQRIAEYAQSIFQNIRLMEHVLQLQGIWDDYVTMGLSTHGPADMSYMSPTQFITSRPKAIPSPCSLVDVLVSRTNVPTPSRDREPVFPDHDITSPTRATEGIPRRVRLAGLEMLVEELRKSGQSLLKLYGNELSESHRELSEGNWPRFAQRAVPSHKRLLLYHKECSHWKDKLFSEVLGVLSPSQNAEEICYIAGLWPRITPRSILRQLARDRIGALPDQWKNSIMRYAVSLIRYQQSLRLLELSSRQEGENLLHEIQAISDDVLAESTFDWLLIQVRLLSVEATIKKNYNDHLTDRSQFRGSSGSGSHRSRNDFPELQTEHIYST